MTAKFQEQVDIVNETEMMTVTSRMMKVEMSKSQNSHFDDIEEIF